MPASARLEVDVEGRRLSLSNLGKVLYPVPGFTKGQVIDYYTRVAPALNVFTVAFPLQIGLGLTAAVALDPARAAEENGVDPAALQGTTQNDIIKEYLSRTGDLSTALQLYGGISDPANKGYFVKVMSEKQRLSQVIGRKS